MQHRRIQTISQSVVHAVECDHCGKAQSVEPAKYTAEPEGWHHFTSHHNDWGNDSIDSSEQWDACSWACYAALVRKVFLDYDLRYILRPAPSLEIDGHDWAFIKDMLSSHRLI